jgi:hypothetical protein
VRKPTALILIFTVLVLSVSVVSADVRVVLLSSTDVIGQVTITNVDADDNNRELNGSEILITNTETDVEHRVQIEENGELIYELPLGSYTIEQITAPDGYELNTKVYDCSLNVPSGASASNVKVINASIVFSNTVISDEDSAGNDEAAADEDYDEEDADSAIAPTKSASVINTSDPSDKNPETADPTTIMAGVLLGAICIMGLCLVILKQQKTKKRHS